MRIPRSLALLALYCVLAATVRLGFRRELDRAAVLALARDAPCALLQIGYRASPWLSAQYTVALAAALSGIVAWRTRRWSALAILAGLLLGAAFAQLASAFYQSLIE